MISIEELLAKLKAAKTEPPPPVDKETALADLRTAAGEFYEKNKEMLPVPIKTDTIAGLKTEIANLKTQLISTQKAIATGEGVETIAAGLIETGELKISDLPTAMKSGVSEMLKTGKG